MASNSNTKIENMQVGSISANSINDNSTNYFKKIANDISALKANKDNADKKAEESEKRKEDLQKELNKTINNSIAALNKLADRVRSTTENLVNTQEKILYGLNGTNISLPQTIKELNNALQGSGIVKTEKLYSNLSKLIESGITHNVNQRAYLETLSEDLNMQTKTSAATLNRLILLQHRDLTANRMAIEYSLKEFLNQNYQTSQYIREGFQGVADALIEAESLMTSKMAMSLETTVQTWMGALSSTGFSNTSGLAGALGQLGSGDLSAINGSYGKLIAMGASRSGLSIGDLLTSGLTGSDADKLMSGIVSWLAETNSNSSNVVKNQMANIMGVSVSDLVAASNLTGSKGYSGSMSGVNVNDNIGNLLGDLKNYIWAPTQLNNMLSNLEFGAALSITSDAKKYTAYLIEDTITKMVSEAAGGGSSTLSGLVSAGAGAARLAGLAAFGLSNSGLSSLPENLAASLNGSAAGNIYNKLGGVSDAYQIATAGILTSEGNIRSGSGRSGSMLFNSNTSDAALSLKTSALDLENSINTGANQIYDANDIYKLLVDKLVNPPFATVTRIDEAGNTVRIGNDLSIIQDSMYLTAINTRGIYQLLLEKFGGTDYNATQTEDGKSGIANTDVFSWVYNWSNERLNQTEK